MIEQELRATEVFIDAVEGLLTGEAEAKEATERVSASVPRARQWARKKASLQRNS